MIKKIMALSLMACGVSYAGIDMPSKCKALSSIKNSLDINTKGKQQLILIVNKSNYQAWLTHTPKNPGASAGWTTQISPGKWTALSMNSRDFTFNCVEARPGHEQKVACDTVINACLKTDAVFGPKTKSNYWVAEDLNLNQLLAKVNARGIDTSTD